MLGFPTLIEYELLQQYDEDLLVVPEQVEYFVPRQHSEQLFLVHENLFLIPE